ncbi:MAG: hypothetical protein K2I81_04575 [Alphaproteobacteria bacterium]|nr:hypothetical protein [Alphaproteobacteria bacterium]
MRDNSNKFTKYDFKILAKILTPIVALFIAAGVGEYTDSEKADEEKKDERTEQRAQQFAEYIVAEATKTAKNPTLSDWAIEYYKRDPNAAEELIKGLEADSTKYANAIFRDARDVLNILERRTDKTISFQEAAAHIQKEPAVTYGPKYTMQTEYVEQSDGDMVAIGARAVPTGQTESKGASKVRKMAINKKHLQKISTDLSVMRKAKSIVD